MIEVKKNYRTFAPIKFETNFIYCITNFILK